MADSDREPSLVTLTVAICNLCLRGDEGECHVPGCVFWMCAAPTAQQASRLIDHSFMDVVVANPEVFDGD